MPSTKIQSPPWQPYAHTLIRRLRIHHGVPTQDVREKSELDLLFDAFADNDAGDVVVKEQLFPSRYVPARDVLTAIRLAATLGSEDAETDMRQCGALNVIRDVSVEDIMLLKEVIGICFPRDQLTVVSPDVSDGAVTKIGQDRFIRMIGECLDKIEPVLIVLVRGIALPKHLAAVAQKTCSMAPITQDIVMAYLGSGHLTDQAVACRNLRAILPTDTALNRLGANEICAALRAPDLGKALQQLTDMTRPEAPSNDPRLEDMTGDSPALAAARRLVADLILWREGKAGWHELSRSVLFYGPPGTGKTFLARAMGASAGVSVVNASFGEWQAAGHLGDMLKAMRASFAAARAQAPCILVLDEIDAVGSRSDDDRHATNYRVQVINCFLAEMDNIARQEGVIVVGTANHIERMDPAVLRAGRMDLKIQVPMPDAEALLTMLRAHLREDLADADLRDLSHQAVGRSAADLDAAIRSARSDARHSRKLLTMTMLRQHLGISTAAVDESVINRVAVHEAGHAIAGAALNFGTITSMQVTANGGMILRQPHMHHSLIADIEAEIIYSLAGRAAERLVFGEVSTGAGGHKNSDLAKATRWALEIETTYGLGSLGPVWHAKPEDVHLTNAHIRDKVRHRIDLAEKRAGQILGQNRDALEALARELAHKRSLRAADIQPFLTGISRGPEAKPATTTEETTP